jgi:hypothetical protein
MWPRALFSFSVRGGYSIVLENLATLRARMAVAMEAHEDFEKPPALAGFVL